MEFDLNELTITLELEDDTTLECDVLCRFPIGEQQYIALSPIDSDLETIYLYRFAENEDGEPILSQIETEEEYEVVADRFDEILDEIEFAELDGEE